MGGAWLIQWHAIWKMVLAEKGYQADRTFYDSPETKQSTKYFLGNSHPLIGPACRALFLLFYKDLVAVCLIGCKLPVPRVTAVVNKTDILHGPLHFDVITGSFRC